MLSERLGVNRLMRSFLITNRLILIMRWVIWSSAPLTYEYGERFTDISHQYTTDAPIMWFPPSLLVHNCICTPHYKAPHYSAWCDILTCKHECTTDASTISIHSFFKDTCDDNPLR